MWIMSNFKYLVMADGGALCLECSVSCHKEIQFATRSRNHKDTQWAVIGVEVNVR